MRIQYKLFFLLMLGLASCSDEDKVPAGIIDEDRMAVLLTNIHIIDGDLITAPQQPDSLYKYGMGYYSVMLKKYHTDTTQFKNSFTWYAKHPETLNKIYDNVIKQLEKKTDSLNKIPSSSPDPAKNAKPQ